MSVTEKYKVQSIDSFYCKEWLLKKHYAKRIAPIEYSFGLYENNCLIGICTFGTPFSSNLKSVTTFKMFELNRLCVNDGLAKNTLSFFVSSCIKRMPKPCILVSYADTEMGHHGYIYQATNWIYTGLSAKRTDWKIRGMEHLHGATIADKSRGIENRAEYMREKYGDDFYLQERSRKHRYFFLLGTKKEKKEMYAQLPYKTEPYPKGQNKRYDNSAKITVQLGMF